MSDVIGVMTAAVVSHNGLTSSSGYLSLLDEDETELKEHALLFLNDTVDVFWPEIAEKIELMSPIFIL